MCINIHLNAYIYTNCVKKCISMNFCVTAALAMLQQPLRDFSCLKTL